MFRAPRYLLIVLSLTVCGGALAFALWEASAAGAVQEDGVVTVAQAFRPRARSATQPTDPLFIESHPGAAERGRFVDKLKRTPDKLSDKDPAWLFVSPESVPKERKQFTTKLRLGRQSKRALYEQYIDVIGVNGILDGIETVWPKCHDQAHELGQMVYQRVQDLGKSLRIGADRCYSGYMHGVLMGAFGQARDTAQPGSTDDAATLKPVMNHTCYRDPEMTASYSPGDCAHGVGHALMFLARYEIPEALRGCHGFDDPAMRYYCTTGAYMEYITERDVEDARTKSRLYPCDAHKYPAACARYKLGHVARRHYGAKRTTEELIQECDKLTGKYRLGCFHGLGNAHVGLLATGKISIRAVCLTGSEQEQFVCVEGAVERLAKYWEDRAAKACEELEGANRQTCARAAKNKMYNMTKDFTLYPE